MRPKALLSWSSGKDCAWTLHVVRQRGEFDVVGLLTTFNEHFDRVAMHAVRRNLVEAQARAAGLPLWNIPLPWPCSNEEYERRMRAAVERARSEGITHMIFGDLFLEDVRDYRIAKLKGTGIEPVFPLFGTRADSPTLARTMIASGLKARITCVDLKQLDGKFSGREFDAALLAELPEKVDPCGENGEFHTFCYAGPMFSSPIEVALGEVVNRDGYMFADLIAARGEPVQ
ncbi:MAG TPA: ATP-binding protein [Planctomycetota bacterium]|nr:ATP-binding protein [Planctomycetota bacterium]